MYFNLVTNQSFGTLNLDDKKEHFIEHFHKVNSIFEFLNWSLSHSTIFFVTYSWIANVDWQFCLMFNGSYYTEQSKPSNLHLYFTFYIPRRCRSLFKSETVLNHLIVIMSGHCTVLCYLKSMNCFTFSHNSQWKRKSKQSTVATKQIIWIH